MDEQGLKDYFVFDDADLVANRSGKLSEKQKKKLVKQQKEANKYSLPLAAFFFAIASIFPIAFMPMSISAWQQHQIAEALLNLIAPLIWVTIWGGIGYFFLYSFINDLRSISKINFKKEAGPVHFEDKKSKPGGNLQFILYVGKVKLEVVEDHLRTAMQEGDTYTVYFYKIKGSSGNHVLSAEWLSKGEV
jgi:hypothetical protein